jgi:hypothetical protein
VASERRQPTTGAAACQVLSPMGMPPAPKGNGDEGHGGGGSEVGPPEESATAGGEVGGVPTWAGAAATAGSQVWSEATGKLGASRTAPAGGGVRRAPERAASEAKGESAARERPSLKPPFATAATSWHPGSCGHMRPRV